MNVLINFFGLFFFLDFVMIAGVPFGILYITPLVDKIIYLFLVVICIIFFVLGLKKRSNKLGKFLIGLAIYCWVILSFQGIAYIT